MALNEFITLYPNTYRGYSQDQLAKVCNGWERLYESVTDYKSFIDALYEYKTRNDLKNGKSRRKIGTPEEESYEMYLEEMKKPPQKRNEWLIRRLLPSCEIFTNPEAFKKKYGKYREEFEKY